MGYIILICKKLRICLIYMSALYFTVTCWHYIGNAQLQTTCHMYKSIFPHFPNEKWLQLQKLQTRHLLDETWLRDQQHRTTKRVALFYFLKQKLFFKQPIEQKVKWNKQLLQTTVSGFCVNSAFLSGHLSNVRKMFSGFCNDVKMTLPGITWRQRGSGSSCVVNSQIRTKICVNESENCEKYEHVEKFIF